MSAQETHSLQEPSREARRPIFHHRPLRWRCALPSEGTYVCTYEHTCKLVYLQYVHVYMCTNSMYMCTCVFTVRTCVHVYLQYVHVYMCIYSTYMCTCVFTVRTCVHAYM